MSQANQSHMMTETRLSVYSCCRQYQTRVQFSRLNHTSKYWTVRQNDSEFQTEGALTLKVIADNESPVLSTD